MIWRRTQSSQRAPALSVRVGSRRGGQFKATLADVVECSAEIKPGETGLLIVGEVVRLRGKLDWFRPA